ncbi:MAG: tRNA uridine-5-carboxymethylaminomethyl(34) synthesis GTPase MnmE, partial [Eubacterium sp.]|nr:tRNA uridine-5-carboxymethylaminomethyl(34) synthesis GTPase MnmE [Eubacterium sp.]
LVFRAPKSYTGENVCELSVHGGLFIVEKTLEAVYNAGAVPAEAGEFTKRAFLNGKMDLTQAESVADLISAQGETAMQASFNALQGSLSNKINGILESLMDCSATFNAFIDYPDEDIPELDNETLGNTIINAARDLKSLLVNYDSGQAMVQGIDTAIVGRPNVGKSTLMNLLAGKDKSIVTNIEGTTRDIVEESVRLGSLVLRLNDTAGLRNTRDEVEKIGVERAYAKLNQAMLVLAVFDSNRVLIKEDLKLIEACKGKKAIAIINKIDLTQRADLDVITSAFDKCIYISAKKAESTKELEDAIKELIGTADFDTSAPILANQRQKICCKNAMDYCFEAHSSLISGLEPVFVNSLVDDAINELLSLTGRKANIEVVNNIFSKFCVGK